MNFLNPGDKHFYLGRIFFPKSKAIAIINQYLDAHPLVREWLFRHENKPRKNTISRRKFLKHLRKGNYDLRRASKTRY